MLEDKLKVLMTVIDEGSLSAAASKLGYTPSGISRMMVSLEDELGLTLLERGKNGVSATKECNMLIPSIRNAVFYSSQCEQIAAELRGLDVGAVTVGTSYGAYYRWLAEIIADFAAAYPNIDVRFIHKNSTELSKAIELHQVDMGIISKREAKGKWLGLYNDPMTAWVPQGSQYEEKGYVPVEAFETEPYIEPYPGEDTDSARYFKKHGIRPNIRYTVNDTYAAFCLVEAGLGITLMNNLTMGNWGGKVSAVPIKPEEKVSIGIITANESVSPAAKKLIEYIEKKLLSGKGL